MAALWWNYIWSPGKLIFLIDYPVSKTAGPLPSIHDFGLEIHGDFGPINSHGNLLRVQEGFRVDFQHNLASEGQK